MTELTPSGLARLYPWAHQGLTDIGFTPVIGSDEVSNRDGMHVHVCIYSMPLGGVVLVAEIDINSTLPMAFVSLSETIDGANSEIKYMHFTNKDQFVRVLTKIQGVISQY